MEKRIKDRHNEAILDEARRRYDIAPSNIRLLDGFESFMYEFERDGQAYILRLGHSLRRSAELIQGEAEWINYLAAGGAGVAQAALSAGGQLVEVIADGQGGQFLATAFVKAAGGPMWERGDWTERLMAAYGRELGRLHRLTKDYRPSDPAWKRPEWHEPINVDLGRWLPAAERHIKDRHEALVGELRKLPQDRDSYGLIHQDAHAGNFFVDDGGQITLFDFDDCVHGHFVYDLAMALFYAVANRPDAAEFTPHFWRHFMGGYGQENRIERAWLSHVPAFLKLREIDLYMIIHRSHDPENIDDEWTAGFMEGRRARIEQDAPYLDSDELTWLLE